MANKIFSMKLDLNGWANVPRIEVRRNDFDTTTFSAQIMQDGVPVNLTGLRPIFECIKPDGYYVRDDALVADASSGKVEYTLVKEIFSKTGLIKTAYFVFEGINSEGEDTRLSTPNIPFTVISDATSCNAESTAYVSDLLDKIKSLAQAQANVYGAYWNKSSSPAMARTDAAVGMQAAIGIDGQLVKNDFDHAPIWGEMEEVKDSYGNVFVKIPKFYIRRQSGSDFFLEQVSKTKYPGFYLPWCFWDFTNNKELDYVLVGKHEASLSADGKLESKPDKYPLVQKNIVDFRNYARANNTGGLLGYQQYDLHVHDIITTLFHIEFATLNTQSIMTGWTNGRRDNGDVTTVAETQTNRAIIENSRAQNYRIGQPIIIGNDVNGVQVFYGRTITSIDSYDANNTAISFDGAPVDIAVGKVVYNGGWKTGFSRAILSPSGAIVANDGKYPCAYRGIENPFGSVWTFVDGLNINNGQSWVAKNADVYASNVFASPYEALSYANVHANNFVKDMGLDPDRPYAQLPVSVGGSDSTYYADYYWQNPSGQFVALVGAYWNNGSGAGLSDWSLSHGSGDSYVNIGGRLLKKVL